MAEDKKKITEDPMGILKGYRVKNNIKIVGDLVADYKTKNHGTTKTDDEIIDILFKQATIVHYLGD